MNIKNINLIVSAIAIIAQAIALIVLLSTAAFAQFTLGKHSITITADTMSVKQAFILLEYMIPKGARVCPIVYKDGIKYFRSKYVVNRLFLSKNWAYTERNGKVKLVRI